MPRSRGPLVLLLVTLAGAASGCGRGAGTGEIQDSQLGLSKTSVKSAPIGGTYVYTGKEAGENARLPRPFVGAPTLIPHSIEGLLPITQDSNACVLCHGTPGPSSDVPPPAPPSHFVDSRNAPDVSRDEVAGARWTCTSCHVPQTDAPLLVGNGSTD